MNHMEVSFLQNLVLQVIHRGGDVQGKRRKAFSSQRVLHPTQEPRKIKRYQQVGRGPHWEIAPTPPFRGRGGKQGDFQRAEQYAVRHLQWRYNRILWMVG